MAVKSVGSQTNTVITQTTSKPQVPKTENKTALPVNQTVTVPSDKKVPNLQVDLKKYQLNAQLSAKQTPPPNQLGTLKEGESVPVKIDAKDTQSDVLKKAYTEFAKKAGINDAEGFAAKMVKDGEKIFHNKTNTEFTDAEFEAKKKTGTINMVPLASDMTALRKEKINELTSYGAFDWSVTSAEQKQVVDILKNDPNISQTVKGLEKDGNLGNLIDRVDNTEQRRELVGLLGKKLDDESAKQVLSHLEKLDVKEGVAVGPGGAAAAYTDVSQNLWQARFNISRLGIEPTTTGFDRTKFNDLINTNGTTPFSGVGATGVNPTDGSVPLGDQWNLLWDDKKTVDKYSNPLGDLNQYLSDTGFPNRARQAELLLRQPISTTMPEIYGDKLPSRADVIQAAAKKYNLQPELVAGFILAEQRDQTKNEDAKDYTAATSIKQANTSIGLGQVVVSTAERNNLFSDLMSDKTQKSLKHNDRARLLADDTVNIFAAAKYLRQIADEGATKSITALPNTKAAYPNINLSDYKKNSSQWSPDNIRALGSEYTSRAWDDKVTGWGHFVFEATEDVKRSKVFKP
jgi:hypothetical protein